MLFGRDVEPSTAVDILSRLVGSSRLMTTTATPTWPPPLKGEE
jgi:hypothetical protein